MELVKMLQSTARWPHFMQLPVKRTISGQAWPQHGVVVAGHGPEVEIRNLFDSPHRTMEKVAYRTYADLCADGWCVD